MVSCPSLSDMDESLPDPAAASLPSLDAASRVWSRLGGATLPSTPREVSPPFLFPSYFFSSFVGRRYRLHGRSPLQLLCVDTASHLSPDDVTLWAGRAF